MSTLQKLSELEAHKAAIQSGYDEAAKKAVLDKGKLTARDRITHLLDENSFVEIGTFITSKTITCKGDKAPADGVVCGYGTIEGNLIYVYSQDPTVMAGSIGEMHAKKIVKTYDDAIKMGAPVVGFVDTVGLRLEESIEALNGYGMIFGKMTEASGLVPQIAVVCGDCAGGASFIAGLSDFTFISTKNGQMYLNSPNTLEDKKASFDTVAAPKVHLSESGLANFGAEDEPSLIASVRDLVSFLPSNSEEEAPCIVCHDDLNRVDAQLNQFDFESGNVGHIVTSIVDDCTYLEVSHEYGTKALTAFARMNGATVGIIANTDAIIDLKAVEKITSFVEFCDAFNIPLVTLTQIERIASTVETEKLGIIKAASKLAFAFANASVPKVNVILKEAYGMAYTLMNSKHLGCDYVYAWPTAEVSTMNSESAVKIMFQEELAHASDKLTLMNEKIAEYEAAHSNVYAVAAHGYIDDIIEPAATRKRVIAALEVLCTKQVASTLKKHATV
ncbi:MAG: carboxyl transferase domain-containing protein [Niameybacter sp.]